MKGEFVVLSSTNRTEQYHADVFSSVLLHQWKFILSLYFNWSANATCEGNWWSHRERFDLLLVPFSFFLSLFHSSICFFCALSVGCRVNVHTLSSLLLCLFLEKSISFFLFKYVFVLQTLYDTIFLFRYYIIPGKENKRRFVHCLLISDEWLPTSPEL